jgi:hypothetical protein
MNPTPITRSLPFAELVLRLRQPAPRPLVERPVVLAADVEHHPDPDLRPRARRRRRHHRDPDHDQRDIDRQEDDNEAARHFPPPTMHHERPSGVRPFTPYEAATPRQCKRV